MEEAAVSDRYGDIEYRNGAGGSLLSSYVIRATPRSGSTLLCEALAGTRVAGYPVEYFELLLETGLPRRPRDYFQRSNDPEVWALLDDPEFQDLLGDPGGWYRKDVFEEGGGRDDADDDEHPPGDPPDFDLLLRRAFEHGTTSNGVFGTKIMWAYFRDFVRLARRSSHGAGLRPCRVARDLFPGFMGYIWIRRDDTVRQAVSLWKALQSWQWRQDAGTGGEVRLQAALPRYSFAAIHHLRLRIEEHNMAWKNFFELCGYEPEVIVYERFVEDYEGTVGQILDSLGIRTPELFNLTPPNMKRQADRLSEEWTSRYEEEVGSRRAGGPLLRSI